jgi:hypothetical protein
MLGDLQGVALGDRPEVNTQILTKLPDTDSLWLPPHVAPSSTIYLLGARSGRGVLTSGGTIPVESCAPRAA